MGPVLSMFKRFNPPLVKMSCPGEDPFKSGVTSSPIIYLRGDSKNPLNKFARLPQTEKDIRPCQAYRGGL